MNDDVYVTPFEAYQRAPQKAVVFGPWGTLPVELQVVCKYPDGSMDVVTTSVYGNANAQTNCALVRPGREIWKWHWQ